LNTTIGSYTRTHRVRVTLGNLLPEASAAVCCVDVAWYTDRRKLTHTHTYADRASASADADKAAGYGWQIDAEGSTQGRLNDALWVAGGSVGTFFAGNRQKDEVVVTYVRTEDWRASNEHA
jgi:hypothetical protein